jgi:deoxyribonuclease-4
MKGIVFGTAGIPFSTEVSNTVSGLYRIVELGLGCMELEFVKNIYPKEEDALKIATTASDLNLKLSAHAPYYVNLNAIDDKKIHMSIGLLHKAAQVAKACGAGTLVFHPGFYMGSGINQAYNKVKTGIIRLLSKLEEDNNNITLRPEIAGKHTQFGTLDEILNLCIDLPVLKPTIDFAHYHALTGSFNSYNEFVVMLTEIKNRLGSEALQDMHLHVSGIEYSLRGEKKHLPLKQSDFKYEELIKALDDMAVTGLIICESPNQEDDAIILRDHYLKLIS